MTQHQRVHFIPRLSGPLAAMIHRHCIAQILGMHLRRYTAFGLMVVAALLLSAMFAMPAHAQYELPASGDSATKSTGANATGPVATPMNDPAIEKRLRHLSNELRCLVCQNQNIADSNADLAVDLRNQIRTQLKEGRTDQDILKYMVDRYGDFVLYRPPVKSTTIALWAGPFVLLALALFFLFRQIGRRRERLKTQAFADQDLARARELLNSASSTLKDQRHP